MAETGAIFGGEHSGHYYFRDNYRADSGLIAAVVALGELSGIDGTAVGSSSRRTVATRRPGRSTPAWTIQPAKIEEIARDARATGARTGSTA